MNEETGLPPSAPGSAPDPLGRLAEEFLERFRRGERPALTDYAGRHPELAERIRALFPALLLLEYARPGPRTAVGAAAGPAGAGPPRRLGEYRIVREIGRGGMGVVYEAEQESLGRRVALKVLPPGVLGDARHVERFQREARAAARLHHSNIVPVFGVGEEGGTHYYAMQYIEGQPVDQVLAELRRLRDEGGPAAVASSSGGDPPAGAPSSGDVARSLWQGRFQAAGRTDAGDAGRPAETAGSTEVSAGSSSSLLSDPHRPYARSVAHIGLQIAGALEHAARQGVLHRDVKPSNLLLDVWGTAWLTDFGLARATGTPDLTHPGDLVGTFRYLAPERFEGRADVRSDVYALGLTLYEMLALRPAFDGHDRAELARLIATGQVPRLNRVNPGVPRDLVTVVHKAMAREPGDRYQTAGALAEDLGRFLDDRPIAARRLSVPERGWRWCRRNPALTAVAAALLALAGLAAGGGLWLERRHAVRQGQAREAVEGALGLLPGLRRQGRWAEAEAVLAQAASRLDDAGSDDLRRRLGRARADLDLGKRLEDVWLNWAADVSAGRINFQAVAGEYAAAFERAGLTMTGDEEAVAARVRGSALRDQLVAALDGWALLTPDRHQGARLLEIARRADRDPTWRQRFYDPAVWRDPRALERLARKTRVAELSPQVLTSLGSLLLVKGADEEPLLRAAQQAYPGDSRINFHLGVVLMNRHKPAEAAGFFRVAVALQPESSVMYLGLGDALLKTRQFREAMAVYRRAIELDPGDSSAHNGLGNVFKDQGRLEEAAAAYRRALDLNPSSSAAYNNLGQILGRQGRLEEAITAYCLSLALDPKSDGAHNNLGIALHDQGRLREAVAAYRIALEVDPTNSAAHCNLGNVSRQQGRPGQAVAEYRRAIELDPKNLEAHHNLGIVLQGLGRAEEALAEYRRVIELDPRNVLAHNNLGSILCEKGRLAEALTAFRRAIDIDPRDANAPYNLGVVLQGLGRSEEALVEYRRAIDLDPRSAPAHNNLGNVLRDQGHLEEAIAAYRRAIELDPGLAPPRINLRVALLRSGRFREAREATQRWLDQLPKNDPQRVGAFQQLRQCDHLLALEARLPALLDGKEQAADAAELRGLAALCQSYKRLNAAAARFWAAAFAARPKLADDLGTQDRYNAACAAALAAAGRGADAGKLDEGERTRLRRQALEWLTADLAAWAKVIRDKPPERARAEKALRLWQADGDLAGLRDAAEVARLPAEEQQTCRKLWAEVKELLRQAAGE
jgi:tetratricopeptide (TPR) repeat protein